MRAVAMEDTVVVVIAPDVVRHLFEASPRLASDTGHTLEVQRKALQCTPALGAPPASIRRGDGCRTRR